MSLIHVLALFVSFQAVSALAEDDDIENIEKRYFTSPTIRNVVVHNSAGDVEISGSQKAKSINVTAEKIVFPDGCRLNYQETAETLTIAVEKPSLSWTGIFKTEQKCDVGLSLELPAATNVTVDTSSGSIDIADVTGKVEVKAGSGDINLYDVSGLASAETGSGDIEAENIAPQARLNTSSGDIEVRLATLPEKGQLNVATGSGDAGIALPANAKVASELDAGSGKVSADESIKQTPEAKFKISVKSSSGDIRLKKLF